MRIGLIGPSHDPIAIRVASEMLLELGVDQAIYLGEGATLEALTHEWAHELGDGDSRDFLTRAVALAIRGTPEAIDALLESERAVRSLERLRTLPPPPARAVEMLGDRICLVVHDKKILDEEDIANAAVIVYGASPERLLKRFGPRYFFTPGPLAADGALGVLEFDDEGHAAIVTVDMQGKELDRDAILGVSSRMTVAG